MHAIRGSIITCAIARPQTNYQSVFMIVTQQPRQIIIRIEKRDVKFSLSVKPESPLVTIGYTGGAGVNQHRVHNPIHPAVPPGQPKKTTANTLHGCRRAKKFGAMPLRRNWQVVVWKKLERATGIEPVTSSLGSWHSTAELRPLRGGVRVWEEYGIRGGLST